MSNAIAPPPTTQLVQLVLDQAKLASWFPARRVGSSNAQRVPSMLLGLFDIHGISWLHFFLENTRTNFAADMFLRRQSLLLHDKDVVIACHTKSLHRVSHLSFLVASDNNNWASTSGSPAVLDTTEHPRCPLFASVKFDTFWCCSMSHHDSSCYTLGRPSTKIGSTSSRLPPVAQMSTKTSNMFKPANQHWHTMTTQRMHQKKISKDLRKLRMKHRQLVMSPLCTSQLRWKHQMLPGFRSFESSQRFLNFGYYKQGLPSCMEVMNLEQMSSQVCVLGPSRTHTFFYSLLFVYRIKLVTSGHWWLTKANHTLGLVLIQRPRPQDKFDAGAVCGHLSARSLSCFLGNAVA